MTYITEKRAAGTQGTVQYHKDGVLEGSEYVKWDEITKKLEAKGAVSVEKEVGVDTLFDIKDSSESRFTIDWDETKVSHDMSVKNTKFVDNGAGSDAITISAGDGSTAVTGYSLTLPPAIGTADQVLSIGSTPGTMEWIDQSITPPDGPTGSIQVSGAGGQFGSEIGFTYSSGTLQVTDNNSGIVSGLAEPTVDSQAATKGYVDSIAIQGVKWKNSVAYASTSTDSNFSLTDQDETKTIDGVALSTLIGKRVLLKNQTDPAENAIYDISVGGSANTVSFTLADDLSGAAALSVAVFIENGVENDNQGYIVTDVTGTNQFGSATDITWGKFTHSKTLVGGTANNVQFTTDGSTLSGSGDFTWNGVTLALTDSKALGIGALNLTHSTANGTEFTTDSDFSIQLGDNGGANTFEIKDSDSSIIAMIDSDGAFTASGAVIDTLTLENGANKTVISSGVSGADYSLTLPPTVGTSGQVLSTGSTPGTMEWVVPLAVSGTGGAIQFTTDGTTLSQSTSLKFDSDKLKVGGLGTVLDIYGTATTSKIESQGDLELITTTAAKKVSAILGDADGNSTFNIYDNASEALFEVDSSGDTMVKLLSLENSSGNRTKFAPPSTGSGYTMNLPPALGSTGQVLGVSNNATGELGWVTLDSTMYLSGTNNDILYKKSDSEMEGISGFSYDSVSGGIVLSNELFFGSSKEIELVYSTDFTISNTASSGTSNFAVSLNDDAGATEFKIQNNSKNLDAFTVNSLGAVSVSDSLETPLVKLVDGSANTLSLTVPSSVTSHTLTLPGSQGESSAVLTNDGSGSLSWELPVLQKGFISSEGNATLGLGSWRDVAYSDSLGVYVIVRDAGTEKLAYSTDGKNWTYVPSVTHACICVTWGKGKFVTATGNNSVWYSSDGVNWTMVGVTGFFWDIMYEPTVDIGGGEFGRFVALGNNNVIYSDDGVSWSQATVPSGKSLQNVAYSTELSRFTAVGKNSTTAIVHSTNGGTSWTASGTIPSSSTNTRGLAVSEGLSPRVFVLTDVSKSEGGIYYSTDDCATWTEGSYSATGSGLWHGVAWSTSAKLFVASSEKNGSAATIATSPDGMNWTILTLSSNSRFYRIRYFVDNEQFAAANVTADNFFTHSLVYQLNKSLSSTKTIDTTSLIAANANMVNLNVSGLFDVSGNLGIGGTATINTAVVENSISSKYSSFPNMTSGKISFKNDSILLENSHAVNGDSAFSSASSGLKALTVNSNGYAIAVSSSKIAAFDARDPNNLKYLSSRSVISSGSSVQTVTVHPAYPDIYFIGNSGTNSNKLDVLKVSDYSDLVNATTTTVPVGNFGSINTFNVIPVKNGAGDPNSSQILVSDYTDGRILNVNITGETITSYYFYDNGNQPLDPGSGFTGNPSLTTYHFYGGLNHYTFIVNSKLQIAYTPNIGTMGSTAVYSPANAGTGPSFSNPRAMTLFGDLYLAIVEGSTGLVKIIDVSTTTLAQSAVSDTNQMYTYTHGSSLSFASSIEYSETEQCLYIFNSQRYQDNIIKIDVSDPTSPTLVDSTSITDIQSDITFAQVYPRMVKVSDDHFLIYGQNNDALYSMGFGGIVFPEATVPKISTDSVTFSENVTIVPHGSTTTPYTLTLPQEQGASGAMLSNDGSGGLFFSTEISQGNIEQAVPNTDTAPIERIATFSVGSDVSKTLAMCGDLIYVVPENTKKLNIYDATNPGSISLISSTTTDMPRKCSHLEVHGNRLFILSADSDEHAGIYVVDVSDPASPFLEGSLKKGTVDPLPFSTLTAYFTMHKNYMYLTGAVAADGVMVYDVSNIKNMRKVGDNVAAPTTGCAMTILDGDYLYLLTNTGLYTYSVKVPSAPVRVSSSEPSFTSDMNWMVKKGERIYVVGKGSNSSKTNVYVVNCKDPVNLTIESSLLNVQHSTNPANNSYRASIQGNILYVTGYESDAHITCFDISDPTSIVSIGSTPNEMDDLNNMSRILFKGRHGFAINLGSPAYIHTFKVKGMRSDLIETGQVDARELLVEGDTTLKGYVNFGSNVRLYNDLRVDSTLISKEVQSKNVNSTGFIHQGPNPEHSSYSSKVFRKSTTVTDLPTTLTTDGVYAVESDGKRVFMSSNGGDQGDAVIICAELTPEGGLDVISTLKDDSTPSKISRTSAMKLVGNTLFVSYYGKTSTDAVEHAGFSIIDVSRPERISKNDIIGNINDTPFEQTASGTIDLDVHGNRAYVISSSTGFTIVDISDLTTPTVVHTHTSLSSSARKIKYLGDDRLAVLMSNRFEVFDISTETSPSSLGFVTTSLPSCQDMAVVGNKAYICQEELTENNGVLIVDTLTIQKVGSGVAGSPNVSRSIEVIGNTAFLFSQQDATCIYTALDISDETSVKLLETVTDASWDMVRKVTRCGTGAIVATCNDSNTAYVLTLQESYATLGSTLSSSLEVSNTLCSNGDASFKGVTRLSGKSEASNFNLKASSGYDTKLLAGSSTEDYSLTLPPAQASHGQYLINSGTGLLTWKSLFKRTEVDATTYTATQDDDVIAVVHTATAGVTITLPEISTLQGSKVMKLVVVDEGGNAEVNNITITPSGSDTISGQANFLIDLDYNTVSLYSNGTSAWFVY